MTTVRPSARALFLGLVLLGISACQPAAPAKPDDVSAKIAGDTKESTKDSQRPATTLTRPIRVGIVTWGGYAGGLVANDGFKANKNSIFWKEYGIEVEFVVIDDYPASRMAFKVGDGEGGIDIMWGTADSYALEYDALKSHDPKVIMQNDWSFGGDAIVASQEIKTTQDLKGKRVAMAESTPSHYFALHMLERAKLKATDVTFVFTASSIAAAQLFKEGKVDAAVSWAPDVYDAAKARQGGHILISTKEASSLIADVLIARGAFLKEHPKAVGQFLLGWFHGVELVNKKPQLSYPFMAAGFEGIDDAAAKEMLGHVKLASYEDNLIFFEELGNDEPRGYANIFFEASNIWRRLGKISGRTNAPETVDTKYLLMIRAEAERRFGKIDPPKATSTRSDRTPESL